MNPTHQYRRRPPNAWPTRGAPARDPDRPWSGWPLFVLLALVAAAGWLLAAVVGYGGWLAVHGVRDALPWGGSP